MKKLILFALLTFITSLAFSQYTSTVSDTRLSTTQWDSTSAGEMGNVAKYITVFNWGGDTLWAVTKDDTLTGKVPIPSSMSFTWKDNKATYVRTKTSTGTIKRVIVFTVGYPRIAH
jgi:hypothetical protein